MKEMNLQKLKINAAYDLFGYPKNGLISVLVKNDPKQRFKLNSRSQITFIESKGQPIKARQPILTDQGPDEEVKPKLSFEYVEDEHKLNSATDQLQCDQPSLVALDVEYHGDKNSEIPNLILLQISYFRYKDITKTFVFDVIELGSKLKRFLEVLNQKTILVHDGRMEVALLKHYYNIHFRLAIDTQIIYESIYKTPFASLTQFLGLSGYAHVLKSAIHKQMENGLVWRKPYTVELLQYAADDVELLIKAFYTFSDEFRDARLEKWMIQSSNHLQNVAFPDLAKEMVFDDEFNPVSKCLFEGNDTKIEAPEIQFDLDELKPILPEDIYDALCSLRERSVRDLILDLNERPRVFFNSENSIFLFDNEDLKFTQNDMDSLVSHLDIGSDNRAILNGSFHRISVMRNLQGKVYGVTLQMARFIHGLSTILTDLIYSEGSILFLGPPGTGKSSFIRDCIRLIGKQGKLLIVVDSSNELCGNGDSVHPLLYPARRMMVSSIEKQKEIMIEALQNHTPDILVIDEIGRSNEVSAAKTIRARGVRVIASAHGSFDSLFKNSDLNGILGGFQQVIMSDKTLEKNHDNRKLKLERAGEPVFDTIIELTKTTPRCVNIFRNVSKIVDAKLENQKFTIEKRWASGKKSMFVRLDTHQ